MKGEYKHLVLILFRICLKFQNKFSFTKIILSLKHLMTSFIFMNGSRI